MPPARSLLFVVAMTVAACGGFLGFGDDGDEPAPNPTEDSGGADGIAADPDPAADASGEIGIDAIAAVDAGADVVDQTPIEAGSELLVWAQFEKALVGIDGADGAVNMEQSKVAAIHDQFAARTLATHPAYVSFTFAQRPKVYISFSLVIAAMPASPGAELLQVSGGGTFSLVVTAEGTFGIRSGSEVGTGGKMEVGVVYRVGVEADVAAGTLRTGFVEDVDAGKPSPPAPLVITWPGAAQFDTMLLGAITQLAGFSLAVDDVLVSTKGFMRP